MHITELVLVINFPIFLGWFFKQLKLFSKEDIGALRKFVIKVSVPFIIFRNLYKSNIEDVSQLLPAALAFLIVSLLFGLAVFFLRKLVSKDKLTQNSFCVGSFMGNYGYLGWGVLFYFLGDAGFTRAVFFTVFFWPVFLFIGFSLSILLSGGRFDQSSIKVILKALYSNALVPVVVVILALYMNLQNITIPIWLNKSIESFASITIPAILFTVGLSFSLIIKKAHIKTIVSGTVLRLAVGLVFGILAVLLTSLFFNVDTVTKKVILVESVMPTAAISPFFCDFINCDNEAVSGILTFSTLISLLTLPFWFSIVQTWTWL
jgi:hypothetical protein